MRRWARTGATHPSFESLAGSGKREKMVPSGRLKVKGRSVFQNGKLKSCWRFSSSHRSRWVAGDKEVPGEDTETGGGGTGWWAGGGRGVKPGRAMWQEGWGWGTSAPGPGLKGRPRTPACGPGGEARAPESGRPGLASQLHHPQLRDPAVPHMAAPPSRRPAPREPVHARHPAQGPAAADLDKC